MPALFHTLTLADDLDEVRAYRQESAERHIVGPLRERLTGEDRDLRARLVAAQLTGLLTDQDPGLLGRPLEDVLSAYAPAMQRLIDGS